MKNGEIALLRPIRPEDEPMMVRFHESLSDRTVYMRYLHLMKLEQRISHERLTRICFNDYDRELALVGEAEISGERRILGVGRLQRLRQKPEEAEIAVVVADAFQSLGLGSELLRRLVEVGRQEKVKRLWADILADNSKMRRLCESIGFKIQAGELGDPTVTGCLDLGA
jgi:acetyltransferase